MRCLNVCRVPEPVPTTPSAVARVVGILLALQVFLHVFVLLEYLGTCRTLDRLWRTSIAFNLVDVEAGEALSLPRQPGVHVIWIAWIDTLVEVKLGQRHLDGADGPSGPPASSSPVPE